MYKMDFCIKNEIYLTRLSRYQQVGVAHLQHINGVFLAVAAKSDCLAL